MPPIRGQRSDATSSTTPGGRPNTIGVPEGDIEDLMDRLDDRHAGREGSIKRTFARWPFRLGSLRLSLEHPGGSRATFQVACRNLSRGGMGVLHNAYVHTDTACGVEMPRLDGQNVEIRGKIVRCTHMQGVVHELGMEFGELIQLSDFVELNPLMGWSSFEKVNPETLSGSLMVVTDSDLDERIIGHYLSDTLLKIRCVKTAAEASAETESFDVVVIDLGIEGARELFSTIREKGIAGSMIAIGPDASASTRELLQDVSADGFVFKPLSADRLLSVLADCMLDGDTVEIDPALAGEGSGALVKSCIEQLQQCAVEVREAIAGEDAMRCYAICQHIKTIATPMGLRQVGKLADQASAHVSQSTSVTESGAKLQELVRKCERIRVSSSAAA